MSNKDITKRTLQIPTECAPFFRIVNDFKVSLVSKSICVRHCN